MGTQSILLKHAGTTFRTMLLLSLAGQPRDTLTNSLSVYRSTIFTGLSEAWIKSFISFTNKVNFRAKPFIIQDVMVIHGLLPYLLTLISYGYFKCNVESDSIAGLISLVTADYKESMLTFTRNETRRLLTAASIIEDNFLNLLNLTLTDPLDKMISLTLKKFPITLNILSFKGGVIAVDPTSLKVTSNQADKVKSSDRKNVSSIPTTSETIKYAPVRPKEETPGYLSHNNQLYDIL